MTHGWRSFLFLIAFVFSVGAGLDASQKTTHVKGYTKKDGTHVAAHERKPPKSSGGETSTTSKKEKAAPATHEPTTSSTASKAKRKGPEVAPITSSTTTSGPARDKNGRIARSEAGKRAFEKQTGFPNGRKGYIVDHIVPLACGGKDDTTNMQWQSEADAKAKDKVERRGCK